MVRSGVLVAPKATAYHHITNEMLAASGIPLESALGHLSDALHTLEADGGVLVGHNSPLTLPSCCTSSGSRRRDTAR